MPIIEITDKNWDLAEHVAKNMDVNIRDIINLAVFILGHLDRRATSMWLNRYKREMRIP